MRGINICIASLVLILTGAASATPIVVQPGESTSNDVFVYQGLTSFNFNAFPGFSNLLAAGKTGTGHDAESLLQFDLTGVSLTPGEKAFINLWVNDTAVTGFPGVSPSTSGAVIIDLFANTSGWSESDVTWSGTGIAARPAHGASPIASLTISGVNQWVSFDFTSQLSAWLATPASNFGVTIAQRAVVENGGKVVAVFDSASGANSPNLSVVPEPAAMGLFGLTALFALRRRKRD